jgi:hypothetical protein
MASRIRLRPGAVPFFQPGETVQVAFQAQTFRPYFAVFLGWWAFLLPNPYRVVVVTDRRILVCYAGRFRPTVVRGVERELPRATRIGPPDGFWWRCDTLGGRLYVHRQFHEDVRQADTPLTV